MKQLGETLVEWGMITRDQLNRALEEQKQSRNRRRLGELFIEMGIITQEDVAVALCSQFGYPYLPLKSIFLSQDTCKLIPPDLVHRYQVVPIEKTSNILSVIMADPTDEQAVEALKKLATGRLQIFVSTTGEIENAIRQYYGEEKKHG